MQIRATKRIRRTRIVLQDGDLVRPMLAVSVSKDGGLMLDLCRHAPMEHYRYGVLDVPAGTGSWNAPIREDEAAWSTNLAPKLHYHRSGFISLNATERLDRHGIDATAIGEIGPMHRHCFSFVARHPLLWRAAPARRSDLVFVPSQWPETITIAGFIGPTSNLKSVHLPSNPAPMTVEQDDGRLVPTVLACLDTTDPRYYVWIELHPGREFGSGDEPASILYSFDPFAAADSSTPTEMLGVWSVTADDVASAA
jgi:hypothetical protein